MNIFDIIACIALAWAIFNGWRRGFLMQMVSFVAVIAGLFLALKFGGEVGELIGLENSTASIVGFLIIFLLSLIVITVGGYMMRAVLRFSGLGKADVALGVLFSVLKVGLIVGSLFSWFAVINRNYTLVERATINKSYVFTPMVRAVDTVTPYFENLVDNVVNR